MGTRVFGRRTLLAGAMVAGVAGCFHRKPLRSVYGVRLGRHPGPVRCVVFVDERYAWSANSSSSAQICLWDLAARRLVRTIPAPGSIRELDLVHGDPERLVVTSISQSETGGWAYAVSVLDAATGRELRRVVDGRLGMNSVAGMAALPGDRLLLSHYDRAVPDGSELWSIATSKLLWSYPFAAEWVTPDRRTGLERCRIWDLDTGHVKLELPMPQVTWGVAIAPDGTRAVSQAGGSFLWNASGVIKTFSEKREWLWSGAFTADGGLLITGSDFRFVLRDGHSGALLAALRGHRETVLRLATAPQGNVALSGDRSGNVMLWVLPTTG